MAPFVLLGIFLIFFVGFFAIILNLFYHIGANVNPMKTIVSSETITGTVLSKKEVLKDDSMNVLIYLISPFLWFAKKLMEEDKFFATVLIDGKPTVLRTNQESFLKLKEGDSVSIVKKEISAKRRVTWFEMVMSGDFKTTQEYSYFIDTIV